MEFDMKYPLAATAVAIVIGLALTGLAVAIHPDLSAASASVAAWASEFLRSLASLLTFIRGRRFIIEAILLALVAGLHLALLLEGLAPGQKLRRVELTIISLYLAVIVVNVVSVCIDSLGGSQVA
jgi:hypothetical protein